MGHGDGLAPVVRVDLDFLYIVPVITGTRVTVRGYTVSTFNPATHW